MNQRVELEIEGATIVVSSETIRSRIVRLSLLVRRDALINEVTKILGVEANDNSVSVSIINYCTFSSRIKTIKGKLPFELLLPSDDEKIAIKKILQFFDCPFTEVYETLIDLINRIDIPTTPHLAPGATDKYEDMTIDEIEALPEDEKKS